MTCHRGRIFGCWLSTTQVCWIQGRQSEGCFAHIPNVFLPPNLTFNIFQDEHTRRRKLHQRKPTGQQLTTTWLHKDKHPIPDDMDIKIPQDPTDSDDDGTEWTQTAWLPLRETSILAELTRELEKTSADDAVMATHGTTHIRAKQFRNIYQERQLDSDVMTAYCHILYKRHHKRHCKILPPESFEALHHKTKAKAGNGPHCLTAPAAARYRKATDVFHY